MSDYSPVPNSNSSSWKGVVLQFLPKHILQSLPILSYLKNPRVAVEDENICDSGVQLERRLREECRYLFPKLIVL